MRFRHMKYLQLHHFIQQLNFKDIYSRLKEDFASENIYYDVSKKSYEENNILYLKLIEKALFNLPNIEDKKFWSSLQRIAVANRIVDIPYLITIGQVNFIRNKLMSIFLMERAHSSVILEWSKLCEDIEEDISKIYFNDFLKKFKKRNLIKLYFVHKNVYQNIMTHYEEHLVWINKLIDVLMDKSDHIPELGHHHCEFGSWLYNEHTSEIFDEENFQDIVYTHKELHSVAEQIFHWHKRSDQKTSANKYRHLYILIKKFELNMLLIANDIIMINDIYISNKAVKDELTQLFDRKLLNTIFHNQFDLAKLTDSQFSLVMVDIDYFKKINDNYGHSAGDKVLIHIADLIKEHFRISDFIFRYGGEEFLIILPNTRQKQARELSEALRKEIENSPIVINEQSVGVTVSMGVIEVSTDAHEIAGDISIIHFIEEVDSNLYRAKEFGRNRVV